MALRVTRQKARPAPVPVSSAATRRASNDDYTPMLRAVQQKFDTTVGKGVPLFTTSVDGDRLWVKYLTAFPADERQHHTCHACRRFVQRYGGLVTVDGNGRLVSAMWGDAPGVYRKGFAALQRLVESSVITGVFKSPAQTWGERQNLDPKRGCTWHHMHVVVPASMVHKDALLSADQKAAALKEEYEMLRRGLGEYDADVVGKALAIVSSDTLYRGDKVQGPLQFWADTHKALSLVPGARKANLVWKAAAKAPAGWCHVKTSVASTLLDDLKAGMSFETAKRRFAEKMHPLQYRRPTAAPKAGTVLQAEKDIEKLGAQRSLERRFARLEDVELLWQPQDLQRTVAAKAGMFSYLLTPPRPSPNIANGGSITWVKFQASVLPLAESMEAYAPVLSLNYAGVLTAVHPDAPCLFQWDNHVSWYVYSNGSTASMWGLTVGWTRVDGVMLKPFMWQGARNNGNHEPAAVLILHGANDRGTPQSCVFPENLKSEYHGVRSVIEAHSRRTRAQGQREGTANGLCVGKKGATRVRVTSRGVCTEYLIDRWD